MASRRQRRRRESDPDLEAEGRDEALLGETEPAIRSARRCRM